MPRLLATLRQCQNAKVSDANWSDQGSGPRTQEVYKEIETLTDIPIVEFPPERIASSIVDLWKDLVNAESREDFVRYHRGWIAHAVLLGCYTYNVVKVIERIIEVACCLDLLCQEHHLAIATVESLKSKALSRLTVWDDVQPALIQKMDEINQGCLAHGAPPDSRFRAARDSKVEYWILSRPFVDDEHLMAESLVVQAKNTVTGDVEARITNLEAILCTMNNGDEAPTIIHGNNAPKTAVSGSESNGIEDTTDTEMEESMLSSSDAESLDDRYCTPALRVARQTRQRISLRLESLLCTVHNNAKTREQNAPDLNTLSIPASKPTLRSVGPLDKRSVFQISSANNGKSGPRDASPTPASTTTYDGGSDPVSSHKGRRPAARGH